MQRIYNFFSPPSQEEIKMESQPFLSELKEIVISHPLNEKNKKDVPFLYQEIRSCINILSETIKNTENYKKQKAELIRYQKLFTISCILSTFASGASLGVLHYFHGQLVAILEQTLFSLTNKWNLLNNKKQTIEKEKNGLIDKHKYDETWHCMEDFIHRARPYWLNCAIWKDEHGQEHVFLPTPHAKIIRGAKLADYCWFEKNFQHPDEYCNNAIKTECEILNEFERCINPEFDNINNLQDNINVLQNEMDQYQEEINKIHNTSRWDSSSGCLFLAVSSVGISATMYFAYRWRQAYKAYQDELQKPHDLATFLNPNDLNQFINVADRLNLSLKDVQIENLIECLEMIANKLYLKQKCRLTFLNSELGLTLNQDVAKIILNYAELIPEDGEEISDYLLI